MNALSPRRLAYYALALIVIYGGGALALWIGKGTPEPAVLGYATVFGLGNALFAVGIVLVYRATRVINFAGAAFGVVGAALFYELMSYAGLPYWAALPLGLLAATILGPLVEFGIIRRFRSTSRLVVNVVTIGVGLFLSSLAGWIPGLLGDSSFQPGQPTTPLTHLRWQVFPVVFNGDDLLLVLVALAALSGLAAFLRFSRRGVAVRGSAENADRAALLGVNTHSLSTLVWTIAAALAGLAAVLQVPLVGYSSSSAGSSTATGPLLLALLAAVIAGMDNLPTAVVASAAVSVFQQVVLVLFSNTDSVDLALLVSILVVFVLQRRRLSRVDEAATSSWAATEEVRPIPSALAGLSVVRSGIRRLAVMGVIVVLGFPFVMSDSQTAVGSSFLIDGIVVISVVVLTGWGGQISLGQWAFVAVGAVIGGGLYNLTHMPFLLALLIGSLAGSVVAVVLGFTTLRVRGVYLAVVTLAFAQAVSTLGVNPKYMGSLIAANINRPSFLSIKTTDDRVFYYVCLAALIAMWWAAIGLRRSRTGRVLIAMRENERTAQALGLNLVRTRLATFALSGFMAAFAGVLLAVDERGVSPYGFSTDQSIQIFIAAVIGGLGSIQGALLGALYFAVVDFLVPGDVGRLLASSLGVLLVLLFYPGGLGALAYAGRDAVLRRVAIRRRIWVPSLLPERLLLGASADRAPLLPRNRANEEPEELPVRYRRPSRVRVAGGSQRGRGWTY